jgi:hypothetical protein
MNTITTKTSSTATCWHSLRPNVALRAPPDGEAPVLGTIKKLCWFQVVETRGDINKQKLHQWQVSACAKCTVHRQCSCRLH